MHYTAILSLQQWFSAYECLLPHHRKTNASTSRSPMKKGTQQHCYRCSMIYKNRYWKWNRDASLFSLFLNIAYLETKCGQAHLWVAVPLMIHKKCRWWEPRSTGQVGVVHQRHRPWFGRWDHRCCRRDHGRVLWKTEGETIARLSRVSVLSRRGVSMLTNSMLFVVLAVLRSFMFFVHVCGVLPHLATSFRHPRLSSCL